MNRKIYMAVWGLVLLLTACNTNIQIQQKEDPNPNDTNSDFEKSIEESNDTGIDINNASKESSNITPEFIDTVRKPFSYDTTKDKSDTFEFTLMKSISQESELIIALQEDENTDKLIKLYNLSYGITIPLDVINEDYLEWFKVYAPYIHSQILLNRKSMSFLNCYTNEDMDQNILYYGIVNEGNEETYHGEKSVYGYRKNDILDLSNDYVDNEEPDKPSEEFTIQLDEVTYDRPWYLDYAEEANAMTLVMTWEDYCKIPGIKPGEAKGDSSLPYTYYIMAKEGKGEELRAKVKELFGDVAWVAEGGYFN